MSSYEGSFKRWHPKELYERDGLPEGWFAIRHDCLPEKQDRRHGHGRWFQIKSDYGTIYRVPRFANTLEKNVILLDWEGWLDLNGREEALDSELKLKISRLKWWQCIYLFPFISASFPNPGQRLASYLAMISVALSLVMYFFPWK